MIVIGVYDLTPLGIGRDGEQRDPRAVAEEVHRLNVARVPVAAPFIEGDEDGGALPDRRILADLQFDLAHEGLEEIELR